MDSVLIGNKKIRIGRTLGQGGEGTVYELEGNPNEAVKIYSPPLRPKRESKIRAMVQADIAATSKHIAFPRNLALDHSGAFVGFTMGLAKGSLEIHELFGAKARRTHFPEADFRFLVNTAANLCRVTQSVHDAGCVIGDINQSSVLVSKKATVTLIDADSFQIYTNGQLYRCLVGTEEYTPPELHGTNNYGDIARTIDHDCFGLAVHIFQLLFFAHPYSGVPAKNVEGSLGDYIAANRFAYSLRRSMHTGMAPPPYRITLDVFPDAISHLFETAFDVKPLRRPRAKDWVIALDNLGKLLRQCSAKKTHYYPSSYQKCVWCNLEKDYFPDLHVPSIVAINASETEKAILDLRNFTFPNLGNAVFVNRLPANKPGSAKYNGLRNAKGKKKATGYLLLALAGLGCIFLSPAILLWIILGITGLVMINADIDTNSLKVADKKALSKLEGAVNTLIEATGFMEAEKILSDAGNVIRLYEGLETAWREWLADFQNGKESRQLNEYLDRFYVKQANIPGIGPVKTATLVSFGIETAADINRAAVRRVPGFGSVFTSKLIAWRASCEQGFTPSDEIPASESSIIAQQRATFVANEAKHARLLINYRNELRKIGLKMSSFAHSAQTNQQIKEAKAAKAITEHDLLLLGLQHNEYKTKSFNNPIAARESNYRSPAFDTNFVASNAPGLKRPITNKQPQPKQSQSHPTCPKCNAPMQIRHGKYGRFWGCLKYPSCNGTLNWSAPRKTIYKL